MGRNDRKHSRVQKAACVHAVHGLGLTSDQVATLAKAGELKTADGGRLAAFDISPSTIRNVASWAARRERQAAGNGGHDHDEDGGLPTEVQPKPAPQTNGPRRPWEAEEDRSQALEDSPLLNLLLQRERERAAESDDDTTPPPPPD